jgi:HEAT repeat protein
VSRFADPTHHDMSDADKIDALVAVLAAENGIEREKAREELVKIGSPAVSALASALRNPRERVRWEAAKALTEMGDPAAVSNLIMALDDESFGVRWLAAEGLIADGRDALPPLLEALIHHSDSYWLREGAHHVLRTLATTKGLHDALAPVLHALEAFEAALETPPAAAQALKALQDL